MKMQYFINTDTKEHGFRITNGDKLLRDFLWNETTSDPLVLLARKAIKEDFSKIKFDSIGNFEDIDIYKKYQVGGAGKVGTMVVNNFNEFVKDNLRTGLIKKSTDRLVNSAIDRLSKDNEVDLLKYAQENHHIYGITTNDKTIELSDSDLMVIEINKEEYLAVFVNNDLKPERVQLFFGDKPVFKVDLINRIVEFNKDNINNDPSNVDDVYKKIKQVAKNIRPQKKSSSNKPK